MNQFKEGDYAWYKGSTRYKGPNVFYGMVSVPVKIVKAHDSDLVMRVTREHMIKYWPDAFSLRSDWCLPNGSSKLTPLSDLETLTLLSDPNFKDDYEFFNDV